MKNYTLEKIKENCSELELQILDLYLKRFKQKDICFLLNISRHKIDSLVSKYNLTRFRDRKNYCCNNININDPKFWYFLGLFASDGNLYKCSGVDVIQFTLDDREALEDIKEILQYTGNIYTYYRYDKLRYFLKISDSVLIQTVRDIFKSDCYRKTFNLQFPLINDESCLKMFLRGYIDGDGSFTKGKNKNYYIFKIYCHSLEFYESLFKCLKTITKRVTTSKNHFIEISAQNDMYIFLKYLYSIHPNLGIIRKRERAMQHIRNYELKI